MTSKKIFFKTDRARETRYCQDKPSCCFMGSGSSLDWSRFSSPSQLPSIWVRPVDGSCSADTSREETGAAPLEPSCWWVWVSRTDCWTWAVFSGSAFVMSVLLSGKAESRLLLKPDVFRESLALTGTAGWFSLAPVSEPLSGVSGESYVLSAS